MSELTVNQKINESEEWQPHRPERPLKSEGGKKFRLVSDFEPAGDQPAAIEDLCQGLDQLSRDQVLLGVTG